MRDGDLMEVARALAKEIEAQPLDGKERSISVSIGGTNSGHITIGGTQVVIGRSEPSRITWGDLSDEELNARLAQEKSQRWSGWRGYWLNPPCLLLILLGPGLAWGLLTGVMPSPLAGNIPVLPLVTMAVMLPLFIWMAGIRRVEARHIEDCQSTIDAIKAELRRRRR